MVIILKKLIIYTGCSNEKHNIIVKDEFKDEHMEIIPKNSISFIEKLDVNDILLTTNEIDYYKISDLPKYNRNVEVSLNEIEIIL